MNPLELAGIRNDDLWMTWNHLDPYDVFPVNMTSWLCASRGLHICLATPLTPIHRMTWHACNGRWSDSIIHGIFKCWVINASIIRCSLEFTGHNFTVREISLHLYEFKVMTGSGRGFRCTLSQLVKEIILYYGTQAFTPCTKQRAICWFLSTSSYPVPLNSKWTLSFQVSYQIIVCVCHLPHACYMSR